MALYHQRVELKREYHQRCWQAGVNISGDARAFNKQLVDLVVDFLQTILILRRDWVESEVWDSILREKPANLLTIWRHFSLCFVCARMHKRLQRKDFKILYRIQRGMNAEISIQTSLCATFIAVTDAYPLIVKERCLNATNNIAPVSKLTGLLVDFQWFPCLSEPATRPGRLCKRKIT